MDPYRALAEKLLREKFDGNQAALARALEINATRVSTWLKKNKGNLSGQTALKLCKLAGVPYPLEGKVAAEGDTDSELEKTLDYFNDRWPAEVQTLARMIVAERGVRLTRDEWQEKLDEIESCIGDLVKNITK